MNIVSIADYNRFSKLNDTHKGKTCALLNSVKAASDVLHMFSQSIEFFQFYIVQMSEKCNSSSNRL